jgi:PAS domain S-box-containing protein
MGGQLLGEPMAKGTAGPENRRTGGDDRLREPRFPELAENTVLDCFLVDREGRYRPVNDAWLEMRVYDSAYEVNGQPYGLTQVLGSGEAAQAYLEPLLNGESVSPGRTARLGKDGSIGHHTIAAKTIPRGGEVVGVEGPLTDATEREETPRLNEARLETLAQLGGMTEASLPEIGDSIPQAAIELTSRGQNSKSALATVRPLAFNRRCVLTAAREES